MNPQGTGTGPVSDVCVLCGADTLLTDVPTYSVIRWDPVTETNLLVAVYCDRHGVPGIIP